MRQQIIDAIESNKLILFIGAGFSQPLGFPSWDGLISLILKELALEDDKYKKLDEVLCSGIFSALEILDKIKDKKRKVYEVLDREIDIKLDNLDLDLHRKLGEISSKIITTNYDKLLDNITSLKKVVSDNTFHIADLQNKDNFLLKLHGCIENPEKCVLFQEDYEKLYGDTAAIDKLKNLISDHTILFIGFSMSDEYVKKQFEYIHKIYKGFTKEHFYLTIDSSAREIHGVSPINLDNWTQLGGVLDSLIKIKAASTNINVKAVTSTGNMDELHLNSKEKEVAIALLVAAPIDQENKPNFEKITKHLTKFKVRVECFHFSIEVLRNLDGYDYIIILSQTVKNKFLIEDQYLKSKLITSQDIEENLITDNLKGLFIFTDTQIQLPTSHTSLPLSVLWEEDISSVFFKLFQKKALHQLSNGFIINPEKFDLGPIEKGKAKIVTKSDESKQILSDNIDAKNLVNFVGRKTDLEDISRKIIDTKKQVLTIKGTGGIGKTTTIKKIALELFRREYFPDGIFFVDCEFITNYKSFEYKVAQCFSVESTIDLKEHILQNNIKLDAMIILDNFETLLYLPDKDQFKSLIAFVCDYVNIVITSREWVGLEFEERHEMRNFTNEEAFQLFTKYYKTVLEPEKVKILREEILDKLLNNNPLAIKIIARNLPKYKDIIALKNELEEDFFNIIKDGYEDIFDDESDANIERSKSLYQSIAYSYNSLKSNERLLFELLYLFPDGIHMHNIKKFFSQSIYKRDSKKITDREITSLEHKSLIEINGGFIQLQSILGRFAEYQFVRRSEEEKVDLYKRAFHFMNFLRKIIHDVSIEDRPKGLRIFDNNLENFLKSYDYITAFKEDEEVKMQYLFANSVFFERIHQTKQFCVKVGILKKYFTLKNSDILIETIIANAKYNDGEFEEGYSDLIKSVSIQDMYNLEQDNIVNRNIINSGLYIYMYSNINQVRKFISETNFYNHNLVAGLLFYAGEFSKLKEMFKFGKTSPFITIEMKFNSDSLEIDELESVISNSFYRKEYTQLMQSHYVKAKMVGVDKRTINRLVVTTRYTSGIKSLMLAFIEKDIDEARGYYQSAIQDLQSIRYYYTEAIYFYSKFLIDHDLDESKYWFEKGILLAENNQYSFLHHKFKCLDLGEESDYDEVQFTLPDDYLLDNLIEQNKDVYYEIFEVY